MRQWIVFVMVLSLGLWNQGRPALSSETGDFRLENSPVPETPSILGSAARTIEARLQALDLDLALMVGLGHLPTCYDIRHGLPAF